MRLRGPSGRLGPLEDLLGLRGLPLQGPHARVLALRPWVPRSTMRPCSSTRIWSASITVDSRCAMTSVVRPRATRSSSAWIARSDFESSAEVASSKIRMADSSGWRARSPRAASRRRRASGRARRPWSRSQRQALDEVVDVRGARRRDHLVVARLGPAVADVVEDGVVEQHRVLRHDADRRAQARLRDVAEVLAVRPGSRRRPRRRSGTAAARASTCPSRSGPTTATRWPRRWRSSPGAGSAAPARRRNRPRGTPPWPARGPLAAPGRVRTSRFSPSSRNMRSMSASDCLISRYTMPRKLSGM
jgi:hypothetical protein